MKRARLPLLCLAVLIVLFSVPAFGASAADQPVTVRIEVGYSEGRLYYNKQIPVRVILSNRTRADISGSVELFPFYGSTDVSIPAFVDVSVPFSLADGEEKELVIPVTGTGTFLAGIGCRVLDGSDGVIASCEERFDDVHRRFVNDYRVIGFLTNRQDDPFTFSLLERAKEYYSVESSTSYGDGSQIAAVEHISADRFPSDESLIDSFDMIIVGDLDLADSSPFSDRQKELLSFYLRAGGRIVVGTGARGAETLRGFAEFLSFDPSEACRYAGGTFSAGTKYVGGNFLIMEGLAASELSEDCFTGCAENYGPGLYSASDSVALYVTPFSLADPAFEGSSVNQLYILNLLNADITFRMMISGRRSVTDGPAVSKGNADAGFLVADARDRSPSGIAMAAGILLFSACGVALPLVFLKKRRREKLIPAILCVSALVFSAGLILVGESIKGSDTVFTLNVVRVSDSDVNHAALLTGVYASDRGDRELSYLTPGVSAGISQINLKGNGKLEIPGTLPSRVCLSGDASAIYEDVAKDSRFVDSVKYFDTEYHGLRLFCGGGATFKYQVSIINDTGKDLSDAFLFRDGFYLYVGDLPAGGEVSVDTTGLCSRISGLNYSLVNPQISGIANGTEASKIAVAMTESLADALAPAFYRGMPADESKAEIVNTIKGFRFGAVTQYKSYYYNSLLSAGGPFPSLRKNEDAFRRALVTSCAGTLFETSGSEMILGAFDGSAPDMTPLINGKKARSRYSLTLVYACLQTESAER